MPIGLRPKKSALSLRNQLIRSIQLEFPKYSKSKIEDIIDAALRDTTAFFPFYP